MTWARNASSNVSIPLSTLSSLALMHRNSPRQRERRCCSSLAALGYLVGNGSENLSRRSLASKTMTAMLASTNVAILAAPNLVSIASISMRVFSMETVVLAAYMSAVPAPMLPFPAAVLEGAPAVLLRQLPGLAELARLRPETELRRFP